MERHYLRETEAVFEMAVGNGLGINWAKLEENQGNQNKGNTANNGIPLMVDADAGQSMLVSEKFNRYLIPTCGTQRTTLNSTG